MVEQGMVWYDTGCSGMISGVLQDELMDSSSRIWGLSNGSQIMSSLIWALCPGSWNMSSLIWALCITDITEHELFDMRSLCPGYQIMSSLIWALCVTYLKSWALWYEVSVSRITNIESWALWYYKLLAVSNGVRDPESWVLGYNDCMMRSVVLTYPTCYTVCILKIIIFLISMSWFSSM